MSQLRLFLPPIWILIWAALWPILGGDILMIAGLFVLATTLFVHIREIRNAPYMRREVENGRH